MINIKNIIYAYEYEVVSWVKRHYKELGYSKILEENDKKVPDLIMLRKGKPIRVEIEIYSKSFLKHKHNPKDADEVLCVVNNAKLPIKTKCIKQLKLWYNLQTEDLIKLFKQTRDRIFINHISGQTLDHFQSDWLSLTKEQEKEIKENIEVQSNFLRRKHL